MEGLVSNARQATVEEMDMMMCTLKQITYVSQNAPLGNTSLDRYRIDNADVQ
jgi:hypothetical protein